MFTIAYDRVFTRESIQKKHTVRRVIVGGAL